MRLENCNLAQASQELISIRDFIRWSYSRFNAAELFYGHGTDNAWDEAIHLVLAALHLPPDLHKELLSARLTLFERREICELVSRRIEERIPTPYLTKQAWFAGLPFYIDKRVIIPRSPMAELIEKGFSPWLDGQEVNNILDLCTGSGCIAIACALAFPESTVDAVDISNKALEVIEINVSKYHLKNQVNIIHADLYGDLNKKYDLIVSNPPYVAQEEYQLLPEEYKHEPELALKAADDGLMLVKRILKGAANHLNPEGLLIVEVGNSQEALMGCYPEIPFLWLDFEKGGEGVFLLTASQVFDYQDSFE